MICHFYGNCKAEVFFWGGGENELYQSWILRRGHVIRAEHNSVIKKVL